MWWHIPIVSVQRKFGGIKSSWCFFIIFNTCVDVFSTCLWELWIWFGHGYRYMKWWCSQKKSGGTGCYILATVGCMKMFFFQGLKSKIVMPHLSCPLHGFVTSWCNLIQVVHFKGSRKRLMLESWNFFNSTSSIPDMLCLVLKSGRTKYDFWVWFVAMLSQTPYIHFAGKPVR